MISLFVEKKNEQATLALYRILDSIDLRENIGITINSPGQNPETMASPTSA